MNHQTEKFPPEKNPIILDFHSLTARAEGNEILEHVAKQVIDAQVVFGYSRMHHRHSRTSGRH